MLGRWGIGLGSRAVGGGTGGGERWRDGLIPMGSLKGGAVVGVEMLGWWG